MRLESVDSIFAQLVDNLQVACEQVWMLVEFAADLGFDRLRELRSVCAPEWDLEDVAALHIEEDRAIEKTWFGSESVCLRAEIGSEVVTIT